MGAEFCLKAILCHHDPLLISAHGDRALRFHALGFAGEKGVRPLEQARTIGMAEAFKDAEIVMQGRLPVTLDAFTPVMEARNGIAHLAHHDSAAAEHVVSTALQIAEAVRKELDTPAADFWRGYARIFHDLSRVATMPAIPKVGIEQAAEDLAQAEAEEATRAAMDAAKSAAVTAVDAIARIPLWGDALGSDKAARHALNVAHRAVVSAALHTTSMRAQRAATKLLKSYGYLPTGRDSEVSARDAVAVKTLVARNVEGAFRQALAPELKFTLWEPSSDVVWRPRPHEAAGCGTYLWRWEPCPACPAWGDMYGRLEHDVCVVDECNAGVYCGEHDEGPPTIAHAQAFACPVCCLLLDTEDELEAAYMELATSYEG
ncbi:hypothetical protein [Streptomyces sp. FXY-T5]|uniref:hypothetical protein n=1 Tax=Streptomyces sp. FXY-T5 TaxID=3064901 RepID=UPI0027D21DA0|nr:hypothetical protein [Streptomyces sp. FXY-T5]WMD09817.1 hypothetical protein Q7C01_38150 [Streptomyces sp. FXY-T5]